MRTNQQLSQKILPPVLLACCALSMSACSNVSYSGPHSQDRVNSISFATSEPSPEAPLTRHYQLTPTSKSLSYGTVKIAFSDTDALHINLRREERSYIAQMPIVEHDKYSASFTMGRDSEHKYMSGIQMKWKF